MEFTSSGLMKPKSGMTLLELTVVILVMITLITILFIGTRAWKRGSDRSANIINIRNVQQAVRAHANTRQLAIGSPLAQTDIIGPGKYLGSVTSPNPDITYTGNFDSTIPPVGTLYLTPTYLNTTADAEFAPLAGSYSSW